MTARGLRLLNADCDGDVTGLRVQAGRIAAFAAPSPQDITLDLGGDRLLPGLINAHDHLQLNHFPRLRVRERYTHAAQWIDDIRPRLGTDPLLIAGQAVPREERLWLGGIKNLLSGVTTVAHHDPLYPALLDDGFPTRVVREFGWAHSLTLEGGEAVRESHRQTPTGQPWIIHAAEGLDEDALAEFEQLETLGCIAANTLIVHGVALDTSRRARLAQAGAGLIWCPSSNLHLFDRTVDARDLIARGRVALGSDSRLTGERDLLAELDLARELGELDEPVIEALVTQRAAQLLRLPDRGVLAPGALADAVVLPAGLPLSRASRANIRLVLLGGEVRYADPHYAQALGDAADLVPVQVDGRDKFLSRAIAARLSASTLHETGLIL